MFTEPTPQVPSASGAAPEEVLAGFARVLRLAGLPVTMASTHMFVDAVARLDYGCRSDVYWAGRGVFCTNVEDIFTYDRAFAVWFSDAPLPEPATAEQSITSGYEAAFESGTGGQSTTIAALASPTEWLRHRDVAGLNAAERAWLVRQFQALDVRLPRRPTRRMEPAPHGAIDRVRTVREQRRRAGEPGPLRYARRRESQRQVIFLIDVSGSMKPYADSLLRLAHRVCQKPPRGTVEVFALGTRLTRITRALERRDPDTALDAAGAEIPDWAGGTRLADNVEAFLRQWGRRGLARGATIIIASDGWERGDPADLGRQMVFLKKLAHRVIWSNPHAGITGYEPIQGGITAALPHVDALVAGHSFAAFENILRVVAGDQPACGRGNHA